MAAVLIAAGAALAGPVVAYAQVGYGVEGHVFSSETVRPLAGALVELWSFPQPPSDGLSAIGTTTDAGGFYRFEFQPLEADGDGHDTTQGYAFAYVCQSVVQIVPLYTQLHLGRVYQRNVYLNVPANLTRCDWERAHSVPFTGHGRAASQCSTPGMYSRRR